MRTCPACQQVCQNRKALREHVRATHTKAPYPTKMDSLNTKRKSTDSAHAQSVATIPPQLTTQDAQRRDLDHRIRELFGEHPTVTLGLDALPPTTRTTEDAQPDPLSPQHPADPVPPPPGVPTDDHWTFTKEFEEHPGGTKVWRFTWVSQPAKEETGSLGSSPGVQLSPAHP